MPHPIVEIDELLRLVIGELTEASPRAAVSFALTCRSLEEPTLSLLWRRQNLLTYLVKVLPNHTWVENEHRDSLVIAIGHNPSADEWARLRRYASWMRGLHLGPDGNIPSDTLFKLSSNSLGGVLFPRLEWLRWNIRGAHFALPFFRLFFSSHLGHFTLYTDSSPPIMPRGRSATLVQILSFLPTSLEDLYITFGPADEEPLKDAVSSLVCRSGPSLRSFWTCVPLSEAAIHHLAQLPNLLYWNTIQGPPPTVPASIFPSLKLLQLDGSAALPWLHLLASHEDDTLRNCPTSVMSHSNIRETLKSLDCPWNTIANLTLLSSIVKFRNLVTLRMHTNCSGGGGCTFRLTDHNMEVLAAALPRLETLRLGHPCGLNPCKATVTSLLSISIHCLDLTVLETHFNTLTIIGDMRRLLDGGAGRDEAKCELRSLSVGHLPLEMPGEDMEIVARGFKAIFPYLTNFAGYNEHCWHKLMSKL